MLTKETDQLNKERKLLKAENVPLMEKVYQLQTSVAEKSASLASLNEVQEPEVPEEPVVEEVLAKGLIVMSDLEPNAPGSSKIKRKLQLEQLNVLPVF